jgi:hypothetical protein
LQVCIAGRCNYLKVVSILVEKIMLCEQFRPFSSPDDYPVNNLGAYNKLELIKFQ